MKNALDIFIYVIGNCESTDQSIPLVKNDELLYDLHKALFLMLVTGHNQEKRIPRKEEFLPTGRTLCHMRR